MENIRETTNGHGTNAQPGGTTSYGSTSYPGADERETGARAGLSGEMRNLIADVEDLLKGIANVSDADVARLRERVTGTLRSAKDTLQARTETLRAQASDAASSADTYVRERPWAAIGIAAAIGVAVGLWAGRRGDDY